MDSEIVETITEWEQTPFSDGYQGLRDLADAEFTGAITQGTAWGFMLNGRLIGIVEGSLSTFDGADGTAYKSPAPALPLLYAMQATAEKQTQYYSNKKSIAEADRTLSSGSFTGYIELSENVLSGDYYTVYYGGKSMSVAFVGNSRKLLTDDEAFERADDEVGIYTVYAADLDVIELPEAADDSHDEPTEDTEASTATAGHDETASTTAETTSVETDSEPVDDERSDGSATENASPTDSSGATTPTDSSEATAPADSPEAGSSAATAPSDQRGSSPPAHAGHGAGAARGSTDTNESQSTDQQSASVFSDEAEWRNAKTIPSLEPSDDGQANQSSSRQPRSQSARSSNSNAPSRRQLRKRLKRAEQIMQKAEAQHEQLVDERDAAQAERDAARKELETVKTKLSEAEAEIERLESQLESDSPGAATTASTGSQTLGTNEALAGTNLLVRYASKGDGTLEDAISGAATQEDITANLRIEPHTTFERENVVVDGQPFETFLDGRIELAFVRWLTEEFLFDIQQTGNQTELSGIYETLPAINRAELQGTVSLGTDEEGDELTAAFDLVVRDKRDRPLFVADFNESKQPVGSGMVNSLVRDGSEIVQRDESFAGAFAITTSYYEGAALDAAADATGGGLLSASRGKSFVYISRKQGFHLCLVEQLGETFDLHVPEL